ncbi:MAG: hypothetical protein M3441_11925 [Chloroflexota bacterium]|nr:hypothetical protein [Chloroflexota bacterium]
MQAYDPNPEGSSQEGFEDESQYIDPMLCPRCGVELQFVGTKRFQEGGSKSTHFWLGTWAELFTNREQYDVYVCPRCGRLEMFLDGVGEEFRPN